MYKSKRNKKLHTGSERASEWDSAIADAEEMITDYKERIDRLNRAIKTFMTMRDSGERFPRLRQNNVENKAVEARI